MKLKIVIALMLIGFTAQQCSIGCLVCNTSNQCTLCDTSNNYYLSKMVCAVSMKTNCLILGQDGTCNLCNPNFYLDLITTNCLAVPAARIVTNCNFYGSNQECISCTGSFIISGGRCNAVSQVITNCNSYNPNGSCADCSDGFVLSGDFASCVAAPTNLNCQYFDYINCRQCKTGYIKNQNLYLSRLTQVMTSQQMQIMSERSYDWQTFPSCQAIASTNCMTNTASDVCTQCNTGYFLQSGRCVVFPSQPIPGCLVYNSLVNCVECQPGMFLNGNTCQTNALILNCASYNGAASSTTCTRCSQGFYLSGNTCVLRVSSLNIQNCLTPSPSEDKCDMCVSNFSATDDKIACLPAVANCVEYLSSNSQTTALSCTRCREGFYLSNSGSATTCTSGTIVGCQVYAPNSNNCITCNNGYYFNSSTNTCNAHITIPNCLTYSQNFANTCNVCVSGFYNFAYSVTCTPVSAISGCATYTPNGFNGVMCATCSTGYYADGSICTLIPSVYTNCVNYAASGCTACSAGYMLNIQEGINRCFLPLDYIHSATNSPCSIVTPVLSQNIVVWGLSSITTQTLFTCQTCNTNMYSYSPLRSEAVCVNNNQFNLYATFSGVSNCIRYGYNYAAMPRIVCMECGSGLFINTYQAMGPLSTATNCTQCSNTESNNAVIPDDFLGFVNICINRMGTGSLEFSNTSCRRYGRISSQRIALNTNLINDYTCVVLNQASLEQNRRNFFVLTLPTANNSPNLFYPLDLPFTAAAATVNDFNHGYSNTVDTSLNFPTVFNYKGILKTITAENLSTVPNQAELILKNNLGNCDIVVSYPENYLYKGYAYGTGTMPYVQANPSNTAYRSCFRCMFNFQLSYAIVGSANPPFPSCVQMTNCANPNIVYGGLSTFLNSVFSCHSCSPSPSGLPTYPSIYFETSAEPTNQARPTAGIWTGWTILNVFASNGGSITNNNHGFRCATAPSKIRINTSRSIFENVSVTFPCAAYGYIQPITNFASLPTPPVSPNSLTIHNTCLACPAAHYPTYLAAEIVPNSAPTGFSTNGMVPVFVVNMCTASVNCDVSIRTQYNSCGACISTTLSNTIAYTAYTDQTFANCYPSDTQYCFILDSTNSAIISMRNVCAFCMAGYFLNSDNICDKYTVPNQAANAKFVHSNYLRLIPAGANAVLAAPAMNDDPGFIKIHYSLSWNELPYGASNCINGYTRFPVNNLISNICVLSSYIASSFSTLKLNTDFIPNCLRYNLDRTNGFRCRGCANQYIPLETGTECVLITTVPNCVIAVQVSNPPRCHQCITGYFNIDGVCRNQQISNCLTYQNTIMYQSTISGFLCQTCANTFYISDDKMSCTKGNILNCAIYNSGRANECTRCLSGYFLVTLSNGFYCYPIPQSLNCDMLQDIPGDTGSNTAIISCKACKANNTGIFGRQIWNAFSTANQAQTLCMPFVPITNCLAYSQADSTFTANRFSCTQCASGYWASADTSTCVQRTFMPTQCTTFSATSDVCTMCSSGFFTSTNGQMCIAFPNGIFSCNQYSSATVCTQCNSGYFLANNVCSVSTITITNCQVYSANGICSQCLQGFFLTSQTLCSTPIATGCLTYSSMNACATCQSGFGLQTTNLVTSCVAIAIANCATPTTTFPFTCMTCIAGYFPNSAGVCTLVTTTIANCMVYDSATTCAVCSSTSVLNVAKTVCNSQDYASFIDPNCAQSNLLASPVCATCNLGSIFQNGVCMSCTNNTLASGCWSCNPANQTVCLICRPTYWMNSRGVCTAVNPTPVTANTNGTVSVNKALAFSFIVATLYFDQL